MPDSQPTSFASQLALYEALKRRDERAYDLLYHEVRGTFSHWVYQHAGNEQDAEDAFQKGIMRFVLNLERGTYQYQPTTRVTTVLFDYCKKIWLNELAASRTKTRAVMPPDHDPAANDLNAQQYLEQLETAERVQQALAELKMDCRSLLQWFYIERLSLRVIAERLGVEERSAKQKRFICAKELKKIYIRLTLTF